MSHAAIVYAVMREVSKLFNLLVNSFIYVTFCNIYLNQNSQAVKKECGPQKGQRYEIQGGDQEMAGW